MLYDARRSQWPLRPTDVVDFLLAATDPCTLMFFRAAFGISLSFHFVFELVSNAAYQKFLVPMFHFKFVQHLLIKKKGLIGILVLNLFLHSQSEHSHVCS